MASGILIRTIQFVDEQQREIQLTERRFVSMDMPHLLGLGPWSDREKLVR